MSEQVRWITATRALVYLQSRFQKMGAPVKPGRQTLYRWFKAGEIKTLQHSDGGMWFTTYDWLDEAIMWKRIPPKNGRPPAARMVETDRYTAVQEPLL